MLGDAARRQAARRTTGRQQRRGGPPHPRRRPPTRWSTVVDTMDGAADKAAELAQEPRLMAIFLTADSKVIVQGITGSEGTKHTRRMVASGTKVVGGVNPRKAGSATSTASRSSPPSPRRWSRPAPTSASSSCRRRSPRPPSSRRSTRRSRSPSSSPRASRCTTAPAFWAYNAGQGSTRIIGPNCPGLISPGQVQRRHHPGRHRAEPGPHRPGQQERHADLPDDVRAARLRLLDRRRHRRRPGHRHHAHRRARRRSRTTRRPTRS